MVEDVCFPDLGVGTCVDFRDPAKFSLLILFNFLFTRFIKGYYAANMDAGTVLCSICLEVKEEEG